MKRLLLSGAFAALTLGAMADSLTPQQALSRVYSEGANLGMRYAPAASSRLVDTATLNGVTTYYVFSGENGTMIVSADDVAMPLLGSFDAEVTDMSAIPDNMKWWLGEYSRRIAWAVENQAQGTNRLQVAFADQDVRTATYQNVSAMVTTQWNQGSPYNNMCPLVGSTRTYTGCVATAMAQVMKYHEWPQGAGSGTASVTCNGTTYTMDFSETTFDWANMTNTYSSSSTTTQKEAVALLMKACGYSVNMSYSTSASGAMSASLVLALIDNFGYDAGIYYDHRDLYSYDDWVDLLYNEMAAGRPVLYGGSGDSGGHQFVFDGFRTSDKAFHVNWGWGGSYDGYFLVDALDPEGQGIGGNGGEGFNSGQDAVLGIQKPQSGSVASEPYIMYYGSYSLYATLSGSTIQFNLGGGYFANLSGKPFTSLDFGVQIVNVSTNAVVGTYKSSSVFDYALKSNSGFTAWSVSSLPTLSDGTYDFYTVYRENSGEWKKMRAPYGYNNFLRYQYSSGTGEEISAYPEFEATAYDGPTTVEAGDNLEFTFTVKNTESTSGSLLLTPYLCYYNSGWYIAAQIGNGEMVELAANASKDVTFSGVVDSTISSGTYYIFLVSPEMYIINSDDCMPEITVTGGTDYSVTSLSCSTLEPGKTYRINVGVKNEGSSSISLTLGAFLFDLNYNQEAYLAASSTTTIAAGASKSISIRGTLASTIAAGDHYLVIADLSTYDVVYYEQVTVVDTSAIEDVAADGSDVNAEYIDLSGRKVSGNAKGVLIRRAEGQKAVKIAR